MNTLSIAANAINTRKLGSFLCIAAAGAGIALLCAVMLLSSAVRDGLERNAKGIDIIVGAKGSPLQLVLSSIYHADVPNGNIEAADAEHVMHLPQVAKAIPLALGDNYKGWRIVGTTQDYLELYNAKFEDGKVFSQPFDAVAGSLTRLPVGSKFAAVHGLTIDSDDVHNWHLYTITGLLKPTGTVLDRLILTTVGSVQQLHMHPDLGDPDAEEEYKIGHQVTAVLLKLRSPVEILNLPRSINQSSALLAASPAYELTRFSETMGFGRDVLTVLGAGFIVLSALVLLSTLAASLAARRYDLGVMRVLGASPERLFATVIAEAMILGGTGTIAGLLAGHILAWAVAINISSLRGLTIPNSLLIPGALDAGLLILGLGTGLLAALIPALSAARTDIAGLLARGRA
jgi:putative ABC transport system permease protein